MVQKVDLVNETLKYLNELDENREVARKAWSNRKTWDGDDVWYLNYPHKNRFIKLLEEMKNYVNL